MLMVEGNKLREVFTAVLSAKGITVEAGLYSLSYAAKTLHSMLEQKPMERESDRMVQAQPAKPLTTEQWRAIAFGAGVDEDADDPALVEKLVRAIEAAHGIKEQP